MADQTNAILQFAAAKGQADAQTANNAATVEAIQSTIQNANVADVAATQAAGVAAGQIQAAKDGVQLATSSADAMVKSMMGTDPDAANYRLATLAQQREDAYNKTVELSNVIAQKQQSTLLSDPLGYIENQFTLPADIALHNHYAELHNAAADEFDGIVQSTTAAGQMNKAMEATMTTAQAAANQASIAATSAAQVAKAKQQGAQLNLQGVMDLQRLNQDSLSSAKLGVDVQDAQVRIGMQQAQMAAAQENRKLTLQMRLAQNNELQDKIAAENSAVANYNGAASAIGAAQLPKAIVLARLRRNDTNALSMVTYGEDLSTNAGGKTNTLVAPNPGAAAELYIGAQARPSGTDAPTINFLGTTANSLLKSDPTISSIKDPNARQAALSASILASAEAQATKIDDAVPNIYAAPPLTSIVSAIPAVANNSFVKTSLLPIAQANPNTNLDTTQTLAAAVAAVNNDPTQFNTVVQGITQLYSAAARANNGLKGYAANGLPLQKNYPAAVNAGLFGNKANLEMTDPTQIRAYLLSKAAESVMTSQGRSLGGMFPR